jgi:hypothetical protein
MFHVEHPEPMRQPLRVLTLQEEKRVVLGLLLQPVVTAGLAFFMSPVVLQVHADLHVDFLRAAIGISLAAAVVSFFVTPLIALPAA